LKTLVHERFSATLLMRLPEMFRARNFSNMSDRAREVSSMALVRHPEKSRTGLFNSMSEAMREINPNSWRASTRPFILQERRTRCQPKLGESDNRKARL
jgi:hypothetical protein